MVCRAGRCVRCPDYQPSRAGAFGGDLVRHFDEFSLHPEVPGKRFNSSLIEYRDGYAFAFRNGWKGSEVYLTLLDRELRPVGPCRRLELSHPDAAYGREDPRLFWFRGRLHISFAGVMPSGGHIGYTNVLYARLTEDLAVEQVFYPRYKQRNAWEKNWQFFEHDGDLYAVYSFAPHRILRIVGDSAELAFESRTPAPWQGGEVRGGASPVRVGEEWWCWFHDRIEWPGRLYRAGLYTFSARPPFAVQRMILSPLLSADPNSRPADQYCPVVFPCGAARDGGGRWLVSAGIHDRWSEIFAFHHAGLERQLARVVAPPWWHWLGEPNEPGMWTSIHVDDEYRLRQLELAGGVMLDVGAHVGTFAAAAIDRGAVLIHCYEPSPPAFICLRQNADRLGRVVAFHAAVGGGWARSRVVPSSEATSNTVVTDAAGDVWTVGLDTAIDRAAADSADGRVRLLKLDCEGGEWPALRYASRLGLVDAVAGEYHPGGTPAELKKLLTAAGFAAVEVVERSPTVGLFFARR